MSHPHTSTDWQAKLWDGGNAMGVLNVIFDFTNRLTGKTNQVQFVGTAYLPEAWLESRWETFQTSRATSFEDLKGKRAWLTGGGKPKAYDAKLWILDGPARGYLATIEFKAPKRIPFPSGSRHPAPGQLEVKFGFTGKPPSHIWDKPRRDLDIEPEDDPIDRYAPYEIHSKEDKAIPGDSLFDFDKSDIKPGAEKILKKWLIRLNHRTTSLVKIEGHTDSVGRRAYNYSLSLRRAIAVQQWFIQHGVKDPYSLIPIPRGEDEPIATNKTKEGRQKNRRVVITYRF